MIKEIEIFYFSGTGNAKKIAKWFSECAIKKRIICKILDISKIGSGNIIINPKALIIIISPIHGFNYPKITLDFIKKFPDGKNKIVLMNTRAGARIGNFVTPGLTGIAFLISTIILKFKGNKIVGQIPFDMPSNWISIHPALREKSIKILHQKNYNKVVKHAEKIFVGKRDFIALRDIIQDIIIAPISFLYYLVGRYAFAKTFYASDKCDNCELCIKECPVKAIINISGRPYWTLKCESCMKCMNNCPQRAIETAHGLFVMILIIGLILNSFIPYDFIEKNIFVDFGGFVIKNIIFISLLLAFYRIQHIFLNKKIFAQIIAQTSLTYYKFWGRYKSIADYRWKKSN